MSKGAKFRIDSVRRENKQMDAQFLVHFYALRPTGRNCFFWLSGRLGALISVYCLQQHVQIRLQFYHVICLLTELG